MQIGFYNRSASHIHRSWRTQGGAETGGEEGEESQQDLDTEEAFNSRKIIQLNGGKGVEGNRRLGGEWLGNGWEWKGIKG